MKTPHFEVVWKDAHAEPRMAPNPAFPNGIDIDLSQGRVDCCTAELPYPARRIGAYFIRCTHCGMTVSCTTAGRRDDPRSITVACKLREVATT